MSDVFTFSSYNNEDFVWSRDLTKFAMMYPSIAQSTLHVELRKAVDDVNVVYNWSGADGNLLYSTVPATGYLTFGGNPAINDTITVGTTAVTFVASGASGNQVNIGVDVDATLASLYALLAGSADAQISKCTYSISDESLVLQFKTAGTTGNSFAIAASNVGVTLSSSTLTNGGYGLVLSAPLADVQNLLGDYQADVRLEVGSARVRLFGGTFTFLQGVTR